MKWLFINFLFSPFTFYSLVFSQCPQPGLKFQTTACNGVNDLKVVETICSIIKVKWQGDYSQKYIVKATGVNISNNSTYEAEIQNYACDNDGNWEASISVKPGTTVNWSVHGKCIQENGLLTNYSVTGPQDYIPICTRTNPITQTLKAYPNPTSGELIVKFDGVITSNTKLTISDVSGKNVVSLSKESITRTSYGFKINVYNLATGTYFLNVINADEIGKVRFIIMKN